MSTSDFLVKFNELDESAKDIVIKLIDQLSSKNRKVQNKEPIINWTDKKLDQETIDLIDTAIENYKNKDFSGYKPFTEVFNDVL